MNLKNIVASVLNQYLTQNIFIGHSMIVQIELFKVQNLCFLLYFSMTGT